MVRQRSGRSVERPSRPRSPQVSTVPVPQQFDPPDLPGKIGLGHHDLHVDDRLRCKPRNRGAADVFDCKRKRAEASQHPCAQLLERWGHRES